MAKILFIIPYDHHDIGTRFLGSYLKKNGHDVQSIHFKTFYSELSSEIIEEHHSYQVVQNAEVSLYGLDVNPFTDKELDLLRACIDDYSPDIIGFSVRSIYKVLLARLMPVLTLFSPKALLAAGGFGPTLEPDFFLDAGFDVVIKGEGEEPLLELVNAYESKSPNIFEILNTVWKTETVKSLHIFNEKSANDVELINKANKQSYKNNPMRAMSRDISSYPAPLYGDAYYSCIEQDVLYRNNDRIEAGEEYVTVLGRGCIGTCTYCCGGQIGTLYKDSGHPSIKRRNRSLESIFSELKSLNLEKIKFIRFQDELFTTSSDKLRDFFIWYKKEIDKPFFMYLNYAQLVKHSDIFTLAIDAGWSITGIGIQTGSEEFAKKYYNRSHYNKTYVEYAKILYDADCIVHYQFINGNCYETEEDFKKTIELRRQLPFSIPTPSITITASMRLKVFPKVPLAEMCPNLIKHPLLAKQWARQAFLLNLVNVIPTSMFEALYADDYYHKNPLALQAVYMNALDELQVLYYKNLLDKWKEKPVVFYGAGYFFQKSHKFFAPLQAKCILLDKNFMDDKQTFCNFPIYELEEYIQYNKEVHIICFSAESTAIQMKKKLLRSLGIPREQIETCSRELSVY